MKKFFLFAVLFMATESTNAQAIFVDKYSGRGVISVYISDYDDGSVDLRVNKVSSFSSAKGNEGNWYLESDQFNADYKIHFVDSKINADIVIYYVSHSWEKGWKKTEKQKLFE
jgi:hypothetical protein